MTREQLSEALGQYMSDILSHITTLKEFCDGHSKWNLQRNSELRKMRNIKERSDKVDSTEDKKWKELEGELGNVLKDTLAGLEELDRFLDAVERLAVTSAFVFNDKCPLGDQEVSLATVRDAIAASQEVCPLLLLFKRNARDFFLPNLFNVQVLAVQLDLYLIITQRLRDKLESKFERLMTGSQTESKPSQKMFGRKNKKSVDLGRMSDMSMLDMLTHLKHLSDVRTNQDFRLVYLFQEKAENFMELFSQTKPRMLQFLTELEGSSVQLDNMKRGAQISSVAGSSVGAVGGVLSIVGLALAPVTLGTSLALTMTGVGLGVTSGVNTMVTKGTEVAVNATQQKKAHGLFQSFMEDMEKIQEYLEVVATRSALKGCEVDVDCAEDLKLLRAENTIADLGQVAQTKAAQLIRARAKVWHSEVEAWQKIHDSLVKGRLTFEDGQSWLKMTFYPVKKTILRKMFCL